MPKFLYLPLTCMLAASSHLIIFLIILHLFFDLLMSNVWLMCDNLIWKRNVMSVLFRFVTSPKVAGSIPYYVIRIPY